MEFQRYIPGRPNLLTIPLMPVQEDRSLHFQAGASFHYLVPKIQVWCFTDSYPGVIEVDCSDLSPLMPIKVGDIEKQLPEGMYLHKKWQKLRFNSIVKLTETNSYIQRKNQVYEQADLIREEKKKIQIRMLGQEKKSSKKSGGLQVPKIIASSRNIMDEKKEAQKKMGN